VELAGEAEVDLREVNEDGNGGAAKADGSLEFLKFAVDAGEMEDDLGEAHDGHVFRADDALKAGCGHALAAHTEKVGGLPPLGEPAFEGVD
jgi:hypothetical protein